MLRAIHVRFLLVTSVLTLGGCGFSLFGDDEPAAQETQQTIAPRQVKVPIQAVRSVEMGRTRDGFIITAYGTASGLGYSLPSLRPRRGGAPGNDGYIEYDFVAVEPAQGFQLPPGNTQTRAVRADLPVPLAALQGALGLRVLALSGGVQMDF